MNFLRRLFGRLAGWVQPERKAIDPIKVGGKGARLGPPKAGLHERTVRKLRRSWYSKRLGPGARDARRRSLARDEFVYAVSRGWINLNADELGALQRRARRRAKRRLRKRLEKQGLL